MATRIEELSKSIGDPDRSADRLNIIESSLRDVHRQLMDIREKANERHGVANERIELLAEIGGRHGGKIIDLAQDVANLFTAASKRMDLNDERLRGLPTGPELQSRLAAVEATLVRIEDMLTAEKLRSIPDPMPHKSLGWINIYSYGPGMMHMSRADADMQLPRSRDERRLACVEIFEGDGL